MRPHLLRLRGWWNEQAVNIAGVWLLQGQPPHILLAGEGRLRERAQMVRPQQPGGVSGGGPGTRRRGKPASGSKGQKIGMSQWSSRCRARLRYVARQAARTPCRGVGKA